MGSARWNPDSPFGMEHIDDDEGYDTGYQYPTAPSPQAPPRGAWLDGQMQSEPGTYRSSGRADSWKLSSQRGSFNSNTQSSRNSQAISSYGSSSSDAYDMGRSPHTQTYVSPYGTSTKSSSGRSLRRLEPKGSIPPLPEDDRTTRVGGIEFKEKYPTSLDCSWCGRNFSGPDGSARSSLSRHKTHHCKNNPNKVVKFQCEVCQRLFVRKDGLKKHKEDYCFKADQCCNHS